MDKNLEKLQKVFELIETDKASTEEVAEVIQAILEVIQKMKADVAQEMSAMDSTMAEKHREMYAEMERMESNMEESMKKGDMKAMKECERCMAKMEEMKKDMEQMKEEIPTMPDLMPLEKRITDVEKREIPKIPENLVNENRLLEEVEALKEELKKEIAEVRALPRGGGASRRVFQPFRDDFSSLTDGSTKTFYLSRAPLNDVVFVWGTDFPMILRPTIDFTVANKALTLTDAVPAPSEGATLLVQYFA